MFEYVKANREQLEKVWDFNIANHPRDSRWVRWKKEIFENMKKEK